VNLGLRAVIFLFLSLAAISSEAHPPWGIAVDHSGNIYIADILHNERGTVWKVSPQGLATALFTDFHAHNVNVDRDGNLYTSHGEGEHMMIRRNVKGTIDTLFFTRDIEKYYGGNSMVTPAGDIVFGIDKYIWKLNSDGKKEKLSNYVLDWNQAIYADQSGNIYATDIGDGRGSIIKFNSDGEATQVASNLITRLDRPYDPHQDVLLGMYVDIKENLYVAETAGQRIIKIKGSRHYTFYKSIGSWFPTAITFYRGKAIILEHQWNRGLKGPRIISYDPETKERNVIYSWKN
jgi:DNA-binding beta-propeller fold protein YncE